MKKAFTILTMTVLIIACKNAHREKSSAAKQADILYKEVDDLHGAAMSKSFQLEEKQKKVKAVIDSIARLPAPAQNGLAGYKFRLDSLSTRMQYAGYAMTKWMEEFKWDSATNNPDKRIEYLAAEKLKIPPSKPSAAW